MRRSLLSLALLGAACQQSGDRRAPPSADGRLEVATAERGSVHVLGADTLSDSAAVTRVIPEPDGDAVAFVFADPPRRVSAGLGLLDSARARLVWPDSVGAVWWSGPHALAFESATGSRGVYAVVDVHADTVHAAAAQGAPPASRGGAAAEPVGARARATAYIDSLRVQPEGAPQGGTLRYTVTSLIPAPGDSLVAFYVIARGPGAGERLNPTWYALDVRSGRVAPIDSITGPSGALPEGAAVWAPPSRFIYAKGGALVEARITRR